MPRAKLNAEDAEGELCYEINYSDKLGLLTHRMQLGDYAEFCRKQ
jgi:hypothetical protein